MKISDVRGGREVRLSLKSTDGEFDPIPSRGEEVVLVQQEPVLLLCGRHVYGVDGKGSDAEALNRLLGKGYPYLLHVVSASKTGVTIAGKQFQTPPQRLDDQLQIGIDDRVVSDVLRTFRANYSPERLGEWLRAHLVVAPRSGPHSTLSRAIVSGEVQSSGFRIYGDTLAIDVVLRDDKYTIERVVKGGHPGNRRVMLLEVELKFLDATRTGAVNKVLRQQLDLAIQARGSYLKIWQDYANIEAELTLSRARAFGAFEYLRTEKRRDGGWCFHLAPLDDESARRFRDLPDDVSLEADENPPNFLNDDGEDVLGGGAKRHLVSRVKHFDGKRVDLYSIDHEDDPPSPPVSGYLFISTRGDEIRVRRRKAAEEMLRTGQCELPQIGLVMEGQPIPQSRIPKRAGLSPLVKNLFGPLGPTASQKEALEIAVNTPDICLIQGPPGTGKTKVITALEARLAEIDEETGAYSHRILVSAAQHDAVDNVAFRTEVYGLPAVKVGGRSGSGQSAYDPASAFASEKLEALRVRHKEVLEPEHVLKARREAVICLKAKTTAAERASRLRSIHSQLKSHISPTLGDDLLSHAQELASSTRESSGENELLVKSIRSLRTEVGTFADDGPLQALKALMRLDGQLTPEEVSLLERLGNLDEGQVPDSLDELRTLKENLLDRFNNPPTPVPENCEATTALLVRVFDEVDQKLRSGAFGAQLAIAEFMDELENDTESVRQALEHYSVVVASTLQQSAGRPMLELKKVQEGAAAFESVIIDEAARAHPLDLFIPLSMARRRVVLVGDHRQLPHLLEPMVEEEIGRKISEKTIDEEIEGAIKESLFERLWDRLKDMERKDGIKRTITLDSQFRMHPLLGDFVSRVFYEHHDAASKIGSPRPADEFMHPVQKFTKAGKPCVAAWVNVPISDGAEERGRSKSRPVEARKIAKEVDEVLRTHHGLSVGIIAFYSAQVEEICRELAKLEVMERDETDSNWVISSQFALTTNEEGKTIERLRVGTVDAFQGKEFDIVFLSMTRSNRLPSDTDLDLRRKYGHLLVENRMCVAMSRQQRLLVLVGDRAMAEDEHAPRPLRAFYNFCRGDHGCFI